MAFVLSITADLKAKGTSTFDGNTWKRFIDHWTSPLDEEDGKTVREYIEDGINDKVELQQLLVEFYHMYVVRVRDLDVIHKKLCDGASVFDVVTPSDACWATLTFVDNFDGWKDSYEKLEANLIEVTPKNNETRWKKCRGKTKFYDRVGAEARAFYKSCEVIFSVLQDKRDDRDTELRDKLDRLSIAWWKDNGKAVRSRKRNAPDQVVGKRMKVQATAVNDDVFASYNSLLKSMTGGSTSSDSGITPRKDRFAGEENDGTLPALSPNIMDVLSPYPQEEPV